jgi:hypothetical protein
MEFSSQSQILAALISLKILTVDRSQSSSGRFGKEKKFLDPNAVHVRSVVDKMTLE